MFLEAIPAMRISNEISRVQSQDWVRALAMWAPLALLAILQLLFSVPYLQWDEWDAFAPMIDSSLSGADLLAFFWQHHNVHRHPLAKILYWLTLQLTPSTQPPCGYR